MLISSQKTFILSLNKFYLKPYKKKDRKMPDKEKLFKSEKRAVLGAHWTFKALKIALRTPISLILAFLNHNVCFSY